MKIFNKEMKKYLKENIKNLPFILVAFIMFYGITTLATNYLFNSNEVSYDNTETGLHADEVQGAIDEVFQHATDYSGINTRLTNIENNFLNKTYPIGSIYISTTDSTASAVHDRFGGTWEAYATGRTLIGMGSNGTNNYTTIGATGGASSHTITTDNMPSHTHSFSGTTSGQSADHAHYFSATTSSDGSHAHNFKDFAKTTVNGASNYVSAGISGSTDRSDVSTRAAGAHTHTVAGWTGGVSTDHTHTFSGTTGSAGKGNDISPLSTIDPYITVYMWKRTA